MDTDNMDYHVFWADEDSTIADKVDYETMSYRKVTNSRHLQNTLKKNIGSPEKIKQYIEEGKLKVVLGTEVTPVATTSYELNEVPLEGQ